MKKRIAGVLLFWLMVCSFAVTGFGAEKEAYPYYVTVNLTENIVTVYEKDAVGEYTVPVKAFVCSGGKYTPEGTFRTTQKYVWRPLIGNVWGQYATRITGSYLFHSVPYFEKDKSTLEYEEYNKLGTTASAGCIRLTVEDAKWIYDHCPVGTTVKLYRGKAAEPLKPKAVQKINVNDVEKRGWDPTDPSDANPWKAGELRLMKTDQLSESITSYYEKGTYYVTADDGEKLFSCLGIFLDLKQEGMSVKDNQIAVSYEGSTFSVNCREKSGQVYFKLRDLAELTGGKMSWNGTEKQIGMHYGNDSIFISYYLNEAK